MVTVYLTFERSNLANILASLKLACTNELRGDDVSREELKMELDFEKVRGARTRARTLTVFYFGSKSIHLILHA
jgi:hypothetical protein